MATTSAMLTSDQRAGGYRLVEVIKQSLLVDLLEARLSN